MMADPEATRDFVYVADVVKANILASCGSTGVFNIACGKSISLNALAEMIGNILGRQVKPRYEAPRTGDITHSLADISRAKSLGRRPMSWPAWPSPRRSSGSGRYGLGSMNRTG